MAVVDEISPASYGQDLIRLSLLDPQEVPRAQRPVVIDVDYSRTLPAGVMLPLELTITSESGAALYRRTVFRRLAPVQLTIVPQEGGAHLVRLAEQHHNRWVGILRLQVDGLLTKG